MPIVGACAPETTLSSALSQIDYLTKHVATCPEKEISDILAIVSLDPFLLEGFSLNSLVRDTFDTISIAEEITRSSQSRGCLSRHLRSTVIRHGVRCLFTKVI